MEETRGWDGPDGEGGGAHDRLIVCGLCDSS